MRGIRSFVGFVWLVALVGLVATLAACDTTQPLQVTERTVRLTVTGGNALTVLYDVWDFYEDSDLDGQPDDVDGDGEGDLFLFCVMPTPGGNPVQGTPTSSPWTFGVEVSIVRAGQTQAEVLTTAAALDPAANLTQYDTSMGLNATPFRQPITIFDGVSDRRFVFDNDGTFSGKPRRRHTPLNRSVAAAVTNPLYEIAPTTYGYRQGRCSVADPGDANIDDLPQPFELTVGNGDTVVVRAVRGSLPTALNGLYTLEPVISGELTLDGQPIANVSGEATSSPNRQPGDTISFFFTTR